MEYSADTRLLYNQPLIKLDGLSDLDDEATTDETFEMDEKQGTEENLNISTLIELIEQKRNAHFKYIVFNVNVVDLLIIGGNILMHTAAASNNISMISFLYSLGFDINAQNTLGQTSLHLAIINRNFQAVELLLALNANIFITDAKGISSFEITFQERAPEYVIYYFLKILKISGLSAQEMAGELKNVGCSIQHVLAMNDSEVTGLMLNQRTFIKESESRDLINRAVKSDYPENIEALISFGPGFRQRISILMKKVKDDPNMFYYFKKLIDKKIINPRHFINHAKRTFIKGTQDEIQVYLDIGYDEYARKEANQELFVGLFANCEVDPIVYYEEVNFNLNLSEILGWYAIHITCAHLNEAELIYLLSKGADPNIRGRRGQTAIFVCKKDTMVKILVEAGADLQVVDEDGNTVIDRRISDCIIANLCILEAKGLLKPELTKAFEFYSHNNVLQEKLKSHRQDLEWMKTCNISYSNNLYSLVVKPFEQTSMYGQSDVEINRERKLQPTYASMISKNLEDSNNNLISINLFSVLTDEVEKTAPRVKRKGLVKAILQACQGRKLQSNYVSMISKNLEKANKISELRYKASEFVFNAMKVDSPDHLVIKKIIDYLTYQEMLVFYEIDVE